MRKIILAIFAIVTVSVASFASGLISYVPDGSKGLFFMNLQRIMKLQDIDSALSKNKMWALKWLNFRKELTTYGLSTNDFPAEFLLFFNPNNSQFGVLAKTEITPEKLDKLLEVAKKKESKFTYSKKDVSGQKTYILDFSKEKQLVKKLKKDKLAVTYLKPGVIFITGCSELEKLLPAVKKSKKTGCKSLTDMVNTKSLVWLAFRRGDDKKLKRQMNSLVALSFALDVTGKNNEGVKIAAEMECEKAKDAEMLSMQLNGLMMLFVPQGFNHDSALGQQVMKTIKLRSEGNKIKLDIKLQETLAKKIQSYFEKNSLPLGGKKAKDKSNSKK